MPVLAARDGIAELTEEGWDATMAVLLRAVFLGMKYGAAAMKPRRSGVILSTASVAGLSTACRIVRHGTSPIASR
jgi:NAD(P)-dependent dehydrogenase (short-subunit alcohol dehydrogenase family)